MSKRKILVLTAAALLFAVLSIGGSIAYLQDTSGPIKNTFEAGKLTDPDGKLTLTEHEIVEVGDGTYSLDSNTTSENTYTVLPGCGLPKDPFVTVTVDSKLTAYLFIEVMDSLPEDLSWSVDNAHWTELMSADGENQVEKDGNPIWVYTAGGSAAFPFNGALTQDDTNIIKNKEIEVPGNFDVETLTEDSKLEFNAYLCQSASFDSAADAFTVCFCPGGTDSEE